MVNFEFSDKDGNDQTMTLEFEESAANETLAEIEIHQGKRIAAEARHQRRFLVGRQRLEDHSQQQHCEPGRPGKNARQ